MEKELNLCELLKGHEEETFYSPIFGDVVFKEIYTKELPLNCIGFPILVDVNGETEAFAITGQYFHNGECMLFPSKDQRDWNKWAEEQKPKVPKTWSEYEKWYLVDTYSTIGRYHSDIGEDVVINENELYPIEKAALALIKIHQLIEVGYGGNIADREWEHNYPKFCVLCRDKQITNAEYTYQREPVSFHTDAQRNEFLSYPENVQLVKDFYMI